MILNIDNLVNEIYRSLKNKIDKKITLATFRAGDDPGIISYEKSIKKNLEPLGIEIKSIVLPENVDEMTYDIDLDSLNDERDVDAILVFKPLPSQIDENYVDEIIDPSKDADGISPFNLGQIVVDASERFPVPATAEAVLKLLEDNNIDIKGKDIVIVNNSSVLGKPLSLLLTNRFATVTLCHIFTKDLKKYTKEADILVTGAGVPDLIKPEMIKDGAVVIDCGIAFKEIDNKRVRVGDVSEGCKDVAGMIISATPGLGGGIGALTTAVLAENVYLCSQLPHISDEF